MSNSGPPGWVNWVTTVVVVLLVGGIVGGVAYQQRINGLEERVAALETWARDEMDPWVDKAHIWMRAAHGHIPWEDTDPPDPPADPPPKFGG